MRPTIDKSERGNPEKDKIPSRVSQVEQELENRSEDGSEDENEDEKDKDDDIGNEDKDDDNDEDDEDDDDDDDDDDDEDDDEDEEDVMASEPPGILDWEQTLLADNTFPFEDDHVDSPAADNGKPGYPILLSDSQAKAVENLRSLLRKGPSPKSNDLLEAYTEIIFQIFTSQPLHSSSTYDHTPMEAFLTSAAVSSDLSFRSSLQMSCVFSHMQYLCFFVILSKCLKADDPEEFVHCFFTFP